ncbi:PTC7 [[Candida] subhashii]|uniref:Protein phosphatase n=1 Tax=[Candida] subhashii TaxID=561895 RepID=A0A8J5UKK8_9ASCO|nr:PTC7 [[Candida] subhashii]KAG7665568.1 PTC7 [[Candida] subhashii]
MLVSILTKRSIPITTRNALKSTISKRKFSFSSSSWTSNGSSKSYSTASSTAGAATTTASSINFDSVLSNFHNYDIAVAYQPKDREESNLFKKRNNHNSSAALESPTGEDNLFVSKESPKGFVAIGVADGVGGWSEAGYDSSAISRELCASMKLNFEIDSNESELSPKQLLDDAFNQVMESPKVKIGGTTACLGILSPDKKLKVANLGDSWCGVFRDYKLINETKFQTHNFNTPYQLAKIPRHIVKQAEMEGRRYIIDTPALADEYTWDLQKDDIIMFATDGVTDNVIAQDVEIFLKDHIEGQNQKLDVVAKEFVNEVVKVSKDPTFPSAFAQELSKLTGQKYLGGKEDDITIVLIKVN